VGLMGDLVQAELRKTTTTTLWWALLIPTVLIALGGGLLSGLLGQSIVEVFSSSEAEQLSDALGVTPDQWKFSLLGIGRTINLATMFPLIFGALAIANEVGTRTITTTFLTAPSRVHAMAAKLMVYALWGAIYGLAIIGFVALGIVLTSNSGQMPDAGGWAMLALVCVLSSILMTMFGVGLGALIPNSAGVIVLLIMYFLVIENALQFGLRLSGVPETAVGFLPNGSVDGLTGSVAVDLFLADAGVVPEEGVYWLRVVAGAGGAQAWWLSGLIFFAWVAAAFGGGWARMTQKDIT
jgi:ABC-2 type transport system permease protein